MVWITLAAPSTAARNAGRRVEAIASGKLMPSPIAIAVTLTSTWLPR